MIPITNSVRARAGHAGQGPVPKALAGVAGGYTGKIARLLAGVP